MATQQQVQQSQPQNYKRPPWVLLVAGFIILLLLCLIVGTTIIILSLIGTIHVPWSNTVSTILLTVFIPVLGAMIPLLQWLFSLPFNKTESPPMPQIIIQAPTTSPALPPTAPSYRGIIGFPPPTDPRTIQQREKVVKQVYRQLIQPGI